MKTSIFQKAWGLRRAARRLGAEAPVDLRQIRAWYANITQWASSGLASLQVGAVMTSGAQAGFANLTLANTGTVSNMRLLIGGVTAPTPLPQSNRVYNRGRDGYLHGFVFNAQPNEFTLNFEDFDGDLSALLNHDTVLTLGEWDFVPEGGSINFQNTSWLAARHAASKEASSDNSEGYENLFILSVSGRYEPGNMEFQAPGGFNIQGIASPAQKTPMGTTTLAAFGKQTVYTMRWFSDYICSLLAGVGDGTLATFTLGFSPISTAKAKAYRTDTGVALTVSSVNVGASTVTLSAAVPTGIPFIIIYESSSI